MWRRQAEGGRTRRGGEEGEVRVDKRCVRIRRAEERGGGGGGRGGGCGGEYGPVDWGCEVIFGVCTPALWETRVCD